MEEKQRYLTIDIGGTVVKHSILNRGYEELECGEEPTQKEPGRFLEQLFAVADRYSGQVDGAGICIAGFINPVTGENKDFSVGENFRAWNLKKELSERMKVPVVLENDSNCAALGEMAAGAGKGFKDFALLTIGTGIGGALVMDGRLVRGSHFKAGEAGLALLGTENGRNMRKNAKSHEEGGLVKGGNIEEDTDTGEYTAPGSYVNAEATSKLVREVSRVAGRQIDGPYVFEHLEDPKIRAIYRTWVERIALTAGNLAVLVDPEAVLIGGGICRQERFISDLRERFYALFPHLREYTRLEACKTGNLAGRIGALHLLLEETGIGTGGR